jgi:hypothetical protein
MPALASYDYTVIRIVPRVEREEFVNAGVILFSRTRRFLEARIHLDTSRLAALAPEMDLAPVQRELEAIVQIAGGAPDSGPIGRLSQSERFHWLAAPRSTVIQTSPVHSGICPNPHLAIEKLMQRLVLPPQDAPPPTPPE